MIETVPAFWARVQDAAPDIKISHLSALWIRHGGGVIEGLLSGGKYRRVLEIGTFRGVTAAYMAQFVEHVDTIDLHRAAHLKGWNHRKFWDRLGVNNIDLHFIRNDVDKGKLIARLDFDFAFIDGDHSERGVKNDFSMVKRCGAVLFHDYAKNNAVQKFVDMLPRRQVTVMDIFAFWQADG